MKTTVPISHRLSLMLAIADAKNAGYHHFAAALVALFKLEYPSK